MSISINKEDDIKLNVTETGWVFFNVKGSEKMSDGKYRDIFVRTTVKFVGDCKDFKPKNKAVIHLSNAKLTFDRTKDKEGKSINRPVILVFNCTVIEEGEEGFFEFKNFNKENTPQNENQNNYQDTMVAADDILPF